jgi:hypothetical protein
MLFPPEVGTSSISGAQLIKLLSEGGGGVSFQSFVLNGKQADG